MSRLDKEFATFHANNPKVYDALVRLAWQAKRRGKKKIGIKMLYEVARWEFWIQTDDPDFKLNNNYHSRYARLIMAQEPDLNGIFETRTLHSGGEEEPHEPGNLF